MNRLFSTTKLAPGLKHGQVALLQVTNSIHKEKSIKMQQYIKNFIIPYLYEAQHVSGDTPPIIRSL